MRFALLLLTAVPAFEQSSVESEGRLVKLNVVATNNKGEPVTDLVPADIRIKEDGKSRNVAGLHAAKPSLVPTIVVLDRWNERMAASGSAWIEIRKGLEAVQPGDRVYLYFLDSRGQMVPIRPLPRPDDPRKEFEPSSRQLIAGLDEAVKTSSGFRDVDAMDPVLRVNVTFRGLTALAFQAAAIPGRKNLLWVTHGAPLFAKTQKGDMADFTTQFKEIGFQIAQSDVAIYAVDQSVAGAAADPNGQARAGLQILTGITGGRWFPSNAFSQAMAACSNDARGAYELSYYSPLQDRKYHKVHLESPRRGVHLLTREGYIGGSGPLP